MVGVNLSTSAVCTLYYNVVGGNYNLSSSNCWCMYCTKSSGWKFGSLTRPNEKRRERDRDTNLRKGDTFSRESSVEARNRNAGYAIGSRIAEWQEGKKSAEDARARRVERTS